MAALSEAAACSSEHGVTLPWRLLTDDDRRVLRDDAPPHVCEYLDGSPSAFRGSLATPRLSRREAVVLAQLRADTSVAEIAEVLAVSANTVKTQLKSIYRKLGARNRSEALQAAMEVGTRVAG